MGGLILMRVLVEGEEVGVSIRMRILAAEGEGQGTIRMRRQGQGRGIRMVVLQVEGESRIILVRIRRGRRVMTGDLGMEGIWGLGLEGEDRDCRVIRGGGLDGFAVSGELCMRECLQRHVDLALTLALSVGAWGHEIANLACSIYI